MSTMLATGAALGLGGLQPRLAGAQSGTAPQGSDAGVPPVDPELATQIKGYNYFPEFRHSKDGGKVKNLTPEQLAAAGLTRETWTLDVVSEKDPLLGKPRSRAAGNRNGDAQPLPRPFDNSGVSRLPSATVEITA